MTEINPFSRKGKENSIINIAEMNEMNNFTESSENDFQPMQNLESLNSFNESSLSLSETPKKKFPNFPIKSLFYPDLFLDKKSIQNYLCGLCENVCDDAVKAKGCKCGKIFCKECLKFYYNNIKKECPLCHKYTNGEIGEATEENTFIQNQKMRCANYKENCTWEEYCFNYKTHIEALCPQEIVNCPYKNRGCILKFKRAFIIKHLERCEYAYEICKKCGCKFREKEKDSHILVCGNEIIPCPYNCGQSILRKNLENHKSICDFCKIKCPFSPLGCDEEFLKKEEKNRLNDDRDKHMHLLMENVLSLQNKFLGINERINKLEEIIQSSKNSSNNNVISNIHINNNIEKEEHVESLTNDNSFLLLKSSKRKSSYNNIENENRFENNDINNNILPLEEKEAIYNLLDSTKQYFSIEGNIIEAVHLPGDKHFYVFFDEKYDIDRLAEGEYKIRFKLLSDIDFVCFGLCDKKIVETNKYEFDVGYSKNGKRKNNGTYYLSTNNMAWNCNSNQQCKRLKFEKNKKMSKKDMYFDFCFVPLDCKLEIKMDNREEPIVTFNDVRCIKSKSLSPCIVFLKNCKVETTFFYCNEKKD